MHVNSPAWADENQLKCKKVRFSGKLVKLTQDELFAIFKSIHLLKVYKKGSQIQAWVSVLFKILNFRKLKCFILKKIRQICVLLPINAFENVVHNVVLYENMLLKINCKYRNSFKCFIHILYQH